MTSAGTSSALGSNEPASNDAGSRASPSEPLNTELYDQKRTNKACDQCRKAKSKCWQSVTPGKPCRNCAFSGIECTSLERTHKRGPVRGYIHAIEQRLQQVESVLGTILCSADSRAQDVMALIQQDQFAHSIVDRVNAGPFGLLGRRDGGQEDFLASIMRGNEAQATMGPSRSRKKSRAGRESAATQDLSVLRTPTKEWQDRLLGRLGGLRLLEEPSGESAEPTTSSLEYRDRFHGRERSEKQGPILEYDPQADVPDDVGSKTQHPGSKSSVHNVDSGAKAIGSLSLDENKEVRFHSDASPLTMLSKTGRTDDRHEGGVWKLPMARTWPRANIYVDAPQDDKFSDIRMPPFEIQEYLVGLYFTYFHPTFPIIHKGAFLETWEKMKNIQEVESRALRKDQSGMAEQGQVVSKLLLLAIFAIGARYSEIELPPPREGDMWEAGCDYLADARAILDKSQHQSRISIIQATLILGVREIGIGSMEHGWIYIGLAIRMAYDLGLNRAADDWKYNGVDIFNPREKQLRKQVWWSCCIADQHVSAYLGRSVYIREKDYDTKLPEEDKVEELTLWRTASSIVHKTINYYPSPERLMGCFRCNASLAAFSGIIVDKLYNVRIKAAPRRIARFRELEGRLQQWHDDLPPSLRYEYASPGPVPPPHQLDLHMQYWAAVLLLQRAMFVCSNNMTQRRLSRPVELQQLISVLWGSE